MRVKFETVVAHAVVVGELSAEEKALATVSLELWRTRIEHSWPSRGGCKQNKAYHGKLNTHGENMDIESTRAQLASREVEQRKTAAKRARANLLGENFGKENHAQKCNLARPENVIPTVVLDWQRVLVI